MEATAALTKGRFARALRAYEALRELEPDAAIHRLRVADCLAKLGRRTEAVASYCEAARRYEAAGREAQGHAVWRLAHALDPSDRRAANGLLAAEAILATTKMLPVPSGAPSFDPVEVDVEVFGSGDAVRNELSRKQAAMAVAIAPSREEALEARIETLQDQLGAAQRRSLSDALEADIARARRFGLDLSVLVFDVTPPVPARALPAAEACLRMTDTVTTLPSGRLVVVALGASARGARRIAEKLCDSLAGLTPSLHATAGIGPLVDEAESPPVSGRELLAHADAALERALAAGHRIATASPHWLVPPAGRDVSLA